MSLNSLLGLLRYVEGFLQNQGSGDIPAFLQAGVKSSMHGLCFSLKGALSQCAGLKYHSSVGTCEVWVCSPSVTA